MKKYLNAVLATLSIRTGTSGGMYHWYIYREI